MHIALGLDFLVPHLFHTHVMIINECSVLRCLQISRVLVQKLPQGPQGGLP